MYFWTAYNSGFNIPGQIVKARYNWQDARSGWALWFTAHGPLIIQGSWQTEWNWRLSLLSLRCKSWEGDFYCPLDVLLWSQGSIIRTFPPISDDGAVIPSDCLRKEEVQFGACVGCMSVLVEILGLLWSDIDQEVQHSCSKQMLPLLSCKRWIKWTDGDFTASFKGASICLQIILSGSVAI